MGIRMGLFKTRHGWVRLVSAVTVQVDYPLQYRYGIAPHALIRASLPDVYRLDRELGKAKTRKLVHLVENGFFLKAENTEVSSMTANDYFAYRLGGFAAIIVPE